MAVVKPPDNILEARLIRLMVQYEKDLLRMCCVYLNDRALAEDAVQETFLKAYKALSGFRGDASEKTWLMRIAINTCKDIKRNPWVRWVERRISVEDLPLPAPTASLESTELTQVIMLLPRKYKEVILLRYYQGMPVKEIAQAIGASSPTVSRRLKQAREKLHWTLEGGDADEAQQQRTFDRADCH